MRPAGYPDCVVIINGPEDGIAFPITRAPFHIGRDASCAVNIRLDSSVPPVAAQVTTVSEGYRVRATSPAPVYVDGERAGTIRSRIVRENGEIQVGNTLLVVDCSPDGLASRSQGISSTDDLGWVMQRVLHFARRAMTHLTYGSGRLLRRLLASWKLPVAVSVIALWLTVPGFKHFLRDFAYRVYYLISGAIQNLGN